MIPKGWKVVKIDELGRFVNGGTPKTNNYEYWNGNINWCTPTEITALKGYKYIKNTNRKITEEGLKNSGAQLIPNNSLLVCTRATIGDCAINIGEFTTNQGFKSIIPNLNTNTEFLYYLICAIKPKLIMQSSGSTFLEISKTAFESIKIALPPLPEQQQIAYILTSVDDKLELLQNQKSEFASLKKGLMEQLLTGKVRVKV
jgi:type I restriction enzyme S subunit